MATATYRLQVHAGFDLRAVRRLVPYLARLGVSHVYLSPLLQARPESRHGYDVVDPTRLDPKLGTPADLAALVRTLRRHDMGLVLDVVPNHMAIGSDNRYWTDVLTHGEASQYARWFDVAWRTRRGRPAPVHLPVLGDVRSRVLARGELGLVWEGDRVRVRYFDQRFPLDPAMLAPLVETAARSVGGSRELAAIAAALRALPSRALPAPTGDRAREADVVARLARSPAATRARRPRRAAAADPGLRRGAPRAPTLPARLLAARRRRRQLPPLLRRERARRARVETRRSSPRRTPGSARGSPRASSTSSASTMSTGSPTRSHSSARSAGSSTAPAARTSGC